jgi:TonB family protein
MRRFLLVATTIWIACFVALLSVAAQKATDVAPTAASLPAYPESEDGLKKLIEDIFVAVRSRDNEKASLYFSSLTIPDHNAWLFKMFGPAEGSRLEAKYAELLPKEPDDIRGRFEYALKSDRTNVGVQAWRKPDHRGGGAGGAILDAMLQPIALYSVDGSNPKEKYGAAIGELVYVDGGFRYLDSRVMQELSSAPPPRLRIGGNTQAPKIIRKVDPVRPSAKIKGSVLLHVVIGADGTMNEVTVVSGDPVLAKAAVEAVRQWQYQPTLYNGKAAEVDSSILIEFR